MSRVLGSCKYGSECGLVLDCECDCCIVVHPCECEDDVDDGMDDWPDWGDTRSEDR